MDPNQEIDNSEDFYDLSGEAVIEETVSVDDFIKQLEAKEKDLHITAETTFIEIADGFAGDDEMPDFLVQEFSSNGHKTIEPAAPAKPAVDPQLQKEVGELKDKLEKMEAERSEMFKNSHRRAKDFEVYKARTERERSETFQNQVGNLATQMLPALDNLNRALDFALALPAEKRKEIEDFFEGIMLVNQQIDDIIAGMGVVSIPSVGKIFDPHLHEAVAIEESNEFAPNTICAEVLRGYRIGEKIIRHSLVKVTKPAAAEPVVAKNQEAVPFGEIEIFTRDTEPAAVEQVNDVFELEIFDTADKASDA